MAKQKRVRRVATETLNLRIPKDEKDALRQRAARERVSVTTLIRRFAAGLLALALVACGGSSESFSTPPQQTGGTDSSAGIGGAGGSIAGRSGSAGKSSAIGQPAKGGGSGGGSTVTPEGGRSGHGGHGGKPAGSSGATSDGGASDLAGAGGSIDEGGAGGEAAIGGSGGSGLGGAPVGGSGGSIAGMSGSAGSSAVNGGAGGLCPEHSGTCGTETPEKIIFSTIPYEYCLKITFLAEADVWTGLGAPGTCGVGAPDIHVSGSSPIDMCRVFWGRESDMPPQVRYEGVIVQSAVEPCVTYISKELYDSVPGNSFCSCP